MPKNQNYTWTSKNVLDDVEFKEDEAEIFQELLCGTRKSQTTSDDQMIPGTILRGQIVEIGKDFVVVDVGLKSEGLLPVSEFSSTEELVLGGEIEVYLDQAENDQGQIVLSREKAARQ